MAQKSNSPSVEKSAPVVAERGREVRKHNTEIGYRVQSGHLSLLSRKMINVLLYYAQRMRGQEDAEGKYWVEVSKIVKDAKFNSRDYDLLRESLDELQSVKIIRPTENGGITSDVLIPSFTLDNTVHSTNEALSPGQKKRGGKLIVGFSLPIGVKELLLNPRSNYTVLPINYVASLRTIGGLVLYEITKRYSTNPSGVTNRESWQWWWKILTGAAEGAKSPEYKYFKRDVIKKAVDEINTVTDLRIELIEFKEGRWVKELQFTVEMAKQASFDLDPPPIDNTLLSRITALGVSTTEAEKLIAKHGEEELKANLEVVEERISKPNLPQLDSPAAYLKTALKNRYGDGRKAQKEAVTKKTEKIAKELQEAKEAAELEQTLRRSIANEARDRFDALPEVEQQELLSQFGESIKGPALTSFRKSGLSTQLVSATFNRWLVETFEVGNS
ncbi:replication initiation protein [Dechloromonas sp. ZS-1]|uniref:replication initiation protein n=1 Tax=Dechloromonas sp. ZS-1 TaxID=3138067 RepID=UPI0031FD5464